MAMYKEIAQFLSATPEWIESWISIPVEAKYILSPPKLPEMIAYTFQQLDLPNLIKCIAVNKTWRAEVNFELHRRQELLIKKYWNIVAEKKKIWKELNRAYDRFDNRAGYFLTSEAKKLSDKFQNIAEEKRVAFADQVEVEKLILFHNFASEEEANQILKNIDLQSYGFDPYEVEPESDADPLDYWGDEDPDA